VILLTGTTGFLGAYLLRDLLAHTAAQVVCLVRAESPAAARSRIEENLQRYGLAPTAAQWRRVEALPGDLTKKGLGLPEKTYAELASRVDAVMHSAAAVNFYHDYHRLRGPNVGGVREILDDRVDVADSPVHH